MTAQCSLHNNVVRFMTMPLGVSMALSLHVGTVKVLDLRTWSSNGDERGMNSYSQGNND